MIADVICNWKMTSFMALDDVTSFLRSKDVTNTCKRMRRVLGIGGSSLVHIDFELKKVLLPPPREFCRHILS